jgi:hypothetical protein
MRQALKKPAKNIIDLLHCFSTISTLTQPARFDHRPHARENLLSIARGLLTCASQSPLQRFLQKKAN